jgi:hypothetical protein
MINEPIITIIAPHTILNFLDNKARVAFVSAAPIIAAKAGIPTINVAHIYGLKESCHLVPNVVGKIGAV